MTLLLRNPWAHALLVLCLAPVLLAQNPFDKTVRLAPHLEPALPHPRQAKVAVDKLAALRAKTGRPPNILLVVVDDLGWGDIGVNGGGVVVGAPTPNIDRLAQQGLRLTSTYAQPSCTPTRAGTGTGAESAVSGVESAVSGTESAPTDAMAPCRAAMAP